MTRYFNPLALCLGLGALLASANPVSARPDEPPVNVRVSFADLDINHPAGAEVLLKRIERAAVTVCGERPSLPLQAEDLAYQQCRNDAVGRAVSRMNAPMLTAVANLRLAGH